jgi:hypothetical protein
MIFHVTERRFKMSFANVTQFKYLKMLVKYMLDDIWVIPMPKNVLGHLVLCILPVRPLPQTFIYCIKMHAKLCVYFHVKKNRYELKSESAIQQSTEQNIWTQQEGRKIELEKTAWHGASGVLPFDRHISDKLQGMSDDRDGTHRQHRREERSINVGILSHDNARPKFGARKRITRIEVRDFKAFYVQYRPCTKWLSLVSTHQEISGRPETEVW